MFVCCRVGFAATMFCSSVLRKNFFATCVAESSFETKYGTHWHMGDQKQRWEITLNRLIIGTYIMQLDR